MKKLLTVSLVAMMAVSAARADIASTDYVTDRTGDVLTLTTNSKVLTGAVNELATTVSGVKATADAAATKTALQELTTTVGNNKTAADKTQEDLDTLEATVAGLQGRGDQAAATKKELAELTETVTTNETDIEDKMTTLSGRVTTAEGKIVTLTGAADVEGSVANAKKAGTDAATALETYKTSVANTYATQAALTQGLGEKQDTIDDLDAIRSGAAAGATALQKADITSGSANGTISVEGSDVSVTGLGSAAYANTEAFDAAGAAAAAQTAAIADAASKYQAKALANTTAEAEGKRETMYPTVKLVADMIDTSANQSSALIGAAQGAADAAQSTADSALAKAEANEAAIDGLGALAGKDTIATADIDGKAVTLEKLADGVQTSLGLADSAVQSVTTGTANGNITVDGTQVPVFGLKSAAFAETTAFDAAGAAASAQTAAIAAAKTETESQISALGLTDVSKVAVPTACENGQATCALVYDSTNKTLKWEAIMK